METETQQSHNIDIGYLREALFEQIELLKTATSLDETIAACKSIDALLRVIDYYHNGLV